MENSGLDWPQFFSSALSVIWRMRNDFVFNSTPRNPTRIWGFIRALGMEEIATDTSLGSSFSSLQGQLVDMFAGSSSRNSLHRWDKPPEGWVKQNVDGALRSDLLGSCGGVLRDADGVWKLGFSRNLGDVSYPNVFLIELLAVQIAMNLVISRDFPQVIIESDSQDVIDF